MPCLPSSKRTPSWWHHSLTPSHPVQALDLSSRVAIVRPVDVKYYTKVRDYTDIHVTGETPAGLVMVTLQA
jgi:hypothetical protein